MTPEQQDNVQQRMRELEENPPAKLEDWPDDEAKYLTLGGPEGDHSYDEGPEANLGPSGLRHLAGGAVEIDGEKVDDPERYKGEPIPGGPTDPNAPEDGVVRERQQGDERGYRRLLRGGRSPA